MRWQLVLDFSTSGILAQASFFLAGIGQVVSAGMFSAGGDSSSKASTAGARSVAGREDDGSELVISPKKAKKACVCGACGRSDADPNPCPHRHKHSSHLCFANEVICLPCRSFQNNILLKKMNKTDMVAAYKETEKKVELNVARKNYETKWDNGQVGVMSFHDLPEWVSQVSSVWREDKTFWRYFWAVDCACFVKT